MRLLIPLMVCLQVWNAYAEVNTAEANGSALSTFHQWFTGEFSNFEQFKQWEYDTKTGKADDRFTFLHVHHRFEPVDIEGTDAQGYHVRQRMVATGRVFRERIYLVDDPRENGQIRLRIYTIKAPSLDGAWSTSNITYLPGCDVTWTLDPDGARFVGRTEKDACRITSKRSGRKIIVNDQLVLTDGFIEINDIGRTEDGQYVFGHPERPAYHNAKVRYYDGWAAMKVAPTRASGEVRKPSKDVTASTKVNWRLHRPMRLHDQGGQITLVDARGEPMGYRVELAHLTRSTSKTSLLKLSVVDVSTDKTVAYAWSDPRSRIIGINADWIQVGLTLSQNAMAFAVKTEKKPALVETLADYLVGSFSSTRQKTENSNFQDIHLRTCRVEIPELGDHVLYVEQSATDMIKTPYRQRLYQLSQLADGRLQSAVYTVREPASWRGACDGSVPPTNRPEAFTRKTGCEVYLAFDGSVFKGETQGKECSTTLKGAHYAVAKVELTSKGMKALDRGFDKNDNQVWGSEHGPYHFERISIGGSKNQRAH